MRKYIQIIIVLFLVILTSIVIYHQYNERKEYHTYLDSQFQRQFYDLIGYVENAQVDLAKAMVVNNSKDMIKYLNDLNFHSYMAHEKLTQLPIEHDSIYKTEIFLNQLGDYSTAMANKSLDGEELDEKEMDTLAELHSYANELSQELIELHDKLSKENINFATLKRQSNRDLSKFNEEMKKFDLINFEERMQDYPELIYDGPFSAHLKKIKPKLNGKIISEDEAVKIANKTFKNPVKVVGKLENTIIPGYYLQGTEDNSDTRVSAAISERAGKIIWYFNPREIGEDRIDSEKSIKIAEEFLKDIGYDNMIPTYTMNHGDHSIINFAYNENGVIIYSDLIKVKVASDNGEIIGLGTEGFLINHHKRDIDKPQITENEARQRISDTIKIKNTRLAIIPTAGGKEVLCYEFETEFGNDTYLIYIDANNGKEVEILLMVRDDEGTLVI